MRRFIPKLFTYSALLAGCVIFLLPLVWMFSTAIKPIDQTMSVPPTWLPREYSVNATDGTRRVVRVGAAVDTPSVYAIPQGSSRPVVISSAAIRDNAWHPTSGEPVPLTIIKQIPANSQTLWREIIFSSPTAGSDDPQSTDVVPASDIHSTIKFRWENFPQAIAAMKQFPRYLFNTLLLCVLNVIGTVASSALAAYGFSRIEWRGRDALFTLALATMMIPFPVTMVPLYSLFRWLGWIGTLQPLWVGSFFASAFNVFLLRQFFRQIPLDISEAARIDGCSELRIFWQIILPLCRPALIVVGLFTFLGTWNDFLGPLIYLTDQKDFTLALGLQSFQSRSGGTEWHYLMAASTLVVLPVIALYLAAQRQFIEGVSLSGLK